MITLHHFPLPGTLMGIVDHLDWDRYAIEVVVAPEGTTITVCESISLTEKKIHSYEFIPNVEAHSEASS